METQGLRHGDRLPAESKLATEFDVSRMTLRSALAVLEQEGLVRRHRNQGCVCTIPCSPRRGLMSRTIVLLSDHESTDNDRLYTGGSSVVVSGVIDRVNQHRMNFLRVLPDWNRDAWFREIVDERPCGVIVSFWGRPFEWQLQLAQRLSAARLPFVIFGDHPALNIYDQVSSDHVGGTEQLTRALAARGCKRILRVWTALPGAPWIESHNRGYDRVVGELGLESIPAVQVEGFSTDDVITEQDFRVQVRRLAGYLVEHLHSNNPVDALMVPTDRDAFTALAAARLFGRTDIPVTGYDNRWANAIERQWESALPFATVDKNNHRIGEEMVELLLQRISKTLPVEPQERRIEQQIVLTRGGSPPR